MIHRVPPLTTYLGLPATTNDIDRDTFLALRVLSQKTRSVLKQQDVESIIKP